MAQEVEHATGLERGSNIILLLGSA